MRTTSNDNNNKPSWFALYTSYLHENEVKKLLECNGIRCFIPMHHIKIMSDNQEIKKIIPAIPGIIFANSTKDDIQKSIDTMQFLGFKSLRIEDSYTPVIIPDNDMQQIITADKLNNGQITYLYDVCCSGNRAKVTNGMFCGLEGVFTDIKGFPTKRMVINAGCISAVLPEIECNYVELI